MKINFPMIVQMYHTQAMIALGKIQNPVTGNNDRNLEQAGLLIDILKVLKDKTSGNLEEEESKLLEEALQNLQLVYVKEAETDNKQEQSGAEQ